MANGFSQCAGDAVQRKLFGKVALSCDAALDAFKKLSYKNNPHMGWGLLEQALQRNERLAAKEADTDKLEAIANFQAHLADILQPSNIIETLEAIRQAALLAVDAPDMYLPRRRDSLKSEKRLLAKDLAFYVREHFDKPLYAVVATTVNVVLNLQFDRLTDDAVRKLAHA